MRILIFQHVAGEHPAAFSDHIKATGDTAHIVRFFEGDMIPRLAAFDALIVMGGPMDVWDVGDHPWLTSEMMAIAHWVRDLGKPYLGICLGHQLLVQALGGRCTRLATPVIAVAPVLRTVEPDPIFATLPDRFATLQWHGVAVADLPADAVTLAQTDACAHQAIRVGRHAWGVQFHPEVTPALVTGWMSDPANRAVAIDWLGSMSAATRFAADCEAHCAAAFVQSAALYTGLRQAVLSGKAPHKTTAPYMSG